MKRKLLALICLVLVVSLTFSACGRRKKGSSVEPLKIEILNDDVSLNGQGEYYVRLTYTDGCTYQVKWRVSPSDYSDKEVVIIFDEQNSVARADKATGLVTFHKSGYFSVTLMLADDSAISTTLHIYCE